VQALAQGVDETRLRDLLARFPGLLSPVAAELLAEIGLAAKPAGSLEAAVLLLEGRRRPGVEGLVDAAWDQGILLPAPLRELIAEAGGVSDAADAVAVRDQQDLWARILSDPALGGRPTPLFVVQEHARAHFHHHRTGCAPGALAIAINGLRQVVAAEPDDLPGLSEDRRLLVDALIDDYQDRHLREVLLEARALVDRPPVPTQGRDLLPFAHELLLCKVLLHCHDRFDAPDDLKRVVRITDQVVAGSNEHLRARWESAVSGALSDLGVSEGPAGAGGAAGIADVVMARLHDDRKDVARNYLARALSKLFHRTGQMEYLDRLLRVEQTMVDSPYGSPAQRAMHHANLGTNFILRFEMSGDAADLDNAIAELHEALPLIPQRDTSRTRAMLGIALGGRAQVTESAADLREAIDWATRSLDNLSANNFEYANRNNNLGWLHLVLWRSTADPAHLDQAVSRLEIAVRRSASASRGRAWRMFGLADALSYRYEVERRQSDFVRAYRFFYRGTAMTMDAYPGVALYGLSVWARWLDAMHQWTEAARVYGLALRAEERLFRTQAVRDHKEAWLSHSKGIAGGAAYAFAQAGNPPGAVLALESSRARLLSEALESDRIMAGLLHDGHAALHTRYLAAVRRVEHLERSETGSEETLPGRLDVA
jgi:hypothetical protein